MSEPESRPTPPPAERGAYPRSSKIATRWRDNDVYGHVNNALYYEFMDSAINRVLIDEGGLDIHSGTVIGLCIESHCEFLGPLDYPGDVEVAVRVGHLGSSSVRYETAIFDAGSGAPAAVGWFVHVFVDRDSRRPTPIPEQVRNCLAAIAA